MPQLKMRGEGGGERKGREGGGGGGREGQGEGVRERAETVHTKGRES